MKLNLANVGWRSEVRTLRLIVVVSQLVSEELVERDFSITICIPQIP